MVLVAIAQVLLIVAGAPMALAILASVVVFFLVDPGPNAVLAQRLVAGIQPFPLLAIPFFVVAGVTMANGGIAKRILDLGNALVGHYRGGLAQINVFNSLIMGGMTGSGNADAALDSRILVPLMTKMGYGRGFSAALTAVTGVIAPIIPPGIGLIIYAYLADVSVGRLFMAGIVPALLLGIALAMVVNRISVKRGYKGTHERRPPIREIASTTRKAAWALMMPILLLVGLRIGVFTSTELGAMAAVYALFVGAVIYREISVRDIPRIMRESVEATATIMLLIATSAAFGYVVTSERVPQQLVEAMTSITTEPVLLLLLINVLLLVLGTVFDGTALLVIVVPLLAPIGVEVGIDPIHLGIVVVLNLVIAAVTPPAGTIMYTVCSITRTPVEEYTRESLPFIAALILVLFIVSFVPAISLTLPNLLFGP